MDSTPLSNHQALKVVSILLNNIKTLRTKKTGAKSRPAKVDLIQRRLIIRVFLKLRSKANTDVSRPSTSPTEGFLLQLALRSQVAKTNSA